MKGHRQVTLPIIINDDDNKNIEILIKIITKDENIMIVLM